MLSRIDRSIASVRVGLALTLLPLSCYAQSRNLLDLGAVGASALNNSGQVLLDAGVYSNGAITPLPPLPMAGSTWPHSFGRAINDNGDVAGYARDAADNCWLVLYSNGQLTNLGTPSGNPSTDCPFVGGINNSGQIVGFGDLPGGTYGFIYAAGQYTGIGVSGHTSSFAYAINNLGQAVGYTNTATGTGMLAAAAGFLYSGGNLTDIPVFGSAINDSGQIVSGNLIWSNGVVSQFSTQVGDARAINASGQVVGRLQYYDASNALVQHAFFYNGATIDLNDYISSSDPLKGFVTLGEAAGINQSGLILLGGMDSRDGKGHTYLLQAPLIGVRPGPLSFGSQSLGARSRPLTLTISNPQSAAATLGNPTMPLNFEVLSRTCGATLAAGASCEIQVVFAPQSSGNLTGYLVIPFNGVPMSVLLSGTAPIVATLTASTTTATTGTSITLSWTVSPGSSCIASGGSPSNGWYEQGFSNSGSMAVTETTAGTYTYKIDCRAFADVSATAQVSVTYTAAQPPGTASPPPTTGSPQSATPAPAPQSGGGKFDPYSLLCLVGALGFSVSRRRCERGLAGVR